MAGRRPFFRNQNLPLALAWAMVTVAAAMLFVRGVLPGLSFSGDLTMIHAGARAWLQGENLYDFDTLYDTWQASGGGKERPREERWFVALYPPTTYAVVAPVGALGWPAGRAVWAGLSLVSLAAVAGWGAAWLGGTRRSKPRAIQRKGDSLPGVGRGPWHRGWVLPLLLAAWISCGPVATTFEFGQLGLVVLALVVWAVGTPGWKPPAWVAGLALAMAGCLKPQLAGVFALGFVALGRWRELGWTLGIGLAVAAVAVLRLEAAGVAWATGLLQNVERFAGEGFADPSPVNPVAWQMIHLEPLWRRFFSGGAGIGVAAVLLAGVAAVTWRVSSMPGDLPLDALDNLDARDAKASHPSGERGGPGGLGKGQAPWREGQAPWHEGQAPWHGGDLELPLWVMSVAAVVTLLIAYHRAYDAVLLAVPAVWAMRGLLAGGGLRPALVLGGVAVFWGPMPELLNHLAHRGWLAPSPTWPFALETAVMFHRPAVLVGLLGVLVVAGSVKPRVAT